MIPSESDFWSPRFRQHTQGRVPGPHSACQLPPALNEVDWSGPQAHPQEPPDSPPRPRPLPVTGQEWAGHADAASCRWPACWGKAGTVRQRPRCVVIRRRLEDTIKMAAVSGLVRRPLEQVGSGTRALCAISAHLASPLSVLFLFPPGLRSSEEALSPDGAGGAAGNWLGRDSG